MCGIFAAIQPNSELWNDEALRAATDAIAHRGPDASDCWREGPVFLGHRRLSIIDLHTGAQPMISHDERYVIVYNGETYNYMELRLELERLGHRFVTQSDTEVILEGYRRWGVDCVKRLNGMFAFALWDRETHTLFAARDRLGIKPLCWMYDRGSLLLASTLESLMSLPGLPRRLNYTALRDVMALDYVPAPRTILDDVHKLRPGHHMTWRPGSETPPDIVAYWDIPAPQPTNGISRPELLDEVERLLEASVARQMVSDVPLGAFLSGGIDSSLVAAFMVRHSDQPVKTFSIAFQQQAYDESPIAKEVADFLHTDHTMLYAEESTADDVLSIFAQLDEPFADPTLIPTYVLAGLAREHVTVALSGDGGDEVFGGYDKYLWGEDRYQNPWLPWSRPFKTFLEHLPVRPRGGASIYRKSLTPHEQIRYLWTRYGDFPVFRKDLRSLLAPDVYAQVDAGGFFDPWLAHAERWGEPYTTDVLMRADLRTYLSENCLVKTDRASMMQSLEVRVPFLDELILERVLPLPADTKIHNGQLKALLVPLAQRLLPRSVWDRPKQGFGVPIGYYLSGPWRSLVDEVLDWSEVNVPLFNLSEVRRVVAVNQRTRACGHELWNPLAMLLWLYTHQGKIAF